MDSFLIALNAVVPFLLYLTFGYSAKRFGMVTESFLTDLNRVVFKLFFPCLMFYNIYNMQSDGAAEPRLLLFLGVSILLLEGILLLIIPRIVRENARRGVIIQAIYRGNSLMYCLPLTVSMYGARASSTATVAIALVVSIYNVTSVIILELFNSNRKSGVKELFLNLIKNPLLEGAIAGLVFYLLKIRLPECIATPISAVSSTTTPLALFILGGTLHFSSVKANLRCLTCVTLFKMVVLPALVLPIAYGIGLRNISLFLAVMVFAMPVANSSYPMAQNLGGDGELAGQFVVVSTVLSIATLFSWIYILGILRLL